MKNRSLLVILLMIGILVLAGCRNTAPAATSTPAAPTTEGPFIGYPPASQPVTGNQPLTGYPPPASNLQPAGAPVRENASLMNVLILSITPNEKNTTMVILHVLVNSAQPTDGLDEFNPGVVGTEIDIQVNASDATTLAPGNVINLTVSYRGDEWGGGYYGTGISQEK